MFLVGSVSNAPVILHPLRNPVHCAAGNRSIHRRIYLVNRVCSIKTEISPCFINAAAQPPKSGSGAGWVSGFRPGKWPGWGKVWQKCHSTEIAYRV
jgi:hypothetical protein